MANMTLAHMTNCPCCLQGSWARPSYDSKATVSALYWNVSQSFPAAFPPPMSAFKHLFNDIGKANASKEYAWVKGTVYECKVKTKNATTGEMKVCGQEVPAPNHGPGGLRLHVQRNHFDEFNKIEGSAASQGSGNIPAMFGEAQRREHQQGDKIVLNVTLVFLFPNFIV